MKSCTSSPATAAEAEASGACGTLAELIVWVAAGGGRRAAAGVHALGRAGGVLRAPGGG